MNVSLRELFCEIADLAPEERERILEKRQLPTGLRAEVESLLHYDSATGGRLARRVSQAAQDALDWISGPASRRCGPYRLVRLLGSGGMGAVYLAERDDGEIEQKVAIKLLRTDADQPSWRNRFRRERQLLAYLNHPSIAHLLDAGHTDDGRPYLVMEHVDGIAIDEYAATLDMTARLRLFLLVCDGVSHAHRHLIVHRDLKPSNILVDSSGHPKLLDFGIARLMDSAADDTRTLEWLLTPSYASPEQLRGGVQTTATDIYSLGAVLSRLLTGRCPREPGLKRPETDQPTRRPGQTHARLPRDIDYILRKAMREEPEERYASVDAFANDIRAFLTCRPVEARAGQNWYRVRKFLRRHHAPAAAVMVTVASLLAGISAERQQRDIAETRFLQVRQLANQVLSINETAGGWRNSAKALHPILALSKQHLEELMAEAETDQTLALDVVNAYSVLGRAQGISAADKTEQRRQAEESLSKADLLIEPILQARPKDRKVLLTAAKIGHDRMMLAANDRREGEAAAHGRAAGRRLSGLLALGELSMAESTIVSELFYDLALIHKNLRLREPGIQYARRSIEAGRSSKDAPLRLSLGYSMLADLLRLTGDLEGALTAIREARAHLDNVQFENDTERRSSWCRVLGREGKILGVPGSINLNRPDEALVLLQKVFDLLQEWTQVDQKDAWSRLLFISVGTELGDTARLRDPQRALAVYNHALKRVREVKELAEARRGEAELLAASSYALRRLNRIEEARERIELAFRLLAQTNDYPVDRVIPYEAAHMALRAFGDHLADTGQSQRAADVYETLLSKLSHSDFDARRDLSHALAVSHIQGSLAALHRRNHQRERWAAIAAMREELWRHWDRKLPRNAFIKRQLQLARSNAS